MIRKLVLVLSLITVGMIGIYRMVSLESNLVGECLYEENRNIFGYTGRMTLIGKITKVNKYSAQVKTDSRDLQIPTKTLDSILHDPNSHSFILDCPDTK